MIQRVVCAAIRNSDGVIVCGARHFDGVMHRAIEAIGGERWNRAEEGFIDQFGHFLTRTEAWLVASYAKQITRRVGGDMTKGGTLYSENLY